METRVIIAVILCVGVLVAWSKLVPQAPPPVAPIATSASGTPSGASSGSSSSSSSSSAPAASAPDKPEQLVELSTADERFVFSTTGGTLRHAQLRDAKFRDHEADAASGHDLVTTREAERAALRTTFADASFPPLGGSWQVSQPSADVVSFVNENADVRVEKTYHVDKTRYRLFLDVVVHNKTARNQKQQSPPGTPVSAKASK